MEASPPRSFWCFISYRHADNHDIGRQWASWLHQQIETYEVPSELVGSTNGRGDTIPERIFPVFRDEDELPADADLSSPIYRALDSSKFLVVLCSPRAVQSTYVAAEIAYYKKIGRSDRILAALVEGEPNASWDLGKQAAGLSPSVECFPVPLRHPVDAHGELIESEHAEPIAADFRLQDGSQGWTSPEAYRQVLLEDGKTPRKHVEALVANYRKSLELAKLKIIAGILGVSLGTLTQRDKAYQLEKARRRAAIFRRVAIAMGVLTAGAVAASVVAVVQKSAATAARDAEATQRALAETRRGEAETARGQAEQRRTEAEAAKTLAEQRRIESEARLARSNAQLADRLTREGDTVGAATALWQIPESERHWEWGYLLDRAYPDLARFSIFPANDGVPKDGTLDPSGTRVIAWQTQPQDEEIGIYPVPKEIHGLSVQPDATPKPLTLAVAGSLKACVWSTDGHALVIDGQTVRLLNPDGTQEAEAEIEGYLDSPGFLDAGGRRFVLKTGADFPGDTWKIYQVEGATFREVTSLKETFELEHFESASPDGKRWVATTIDTGAAVYSDTGKLLQKFDGVWGARARFAADGSLAVATIDEAVLVQPVGKIAKVIKLSDTGEIIRRNTTDVTVRWVGSKLYVRNIRGLRVWDLASRDPKESLNEIDFDGEDLPYVMEAGSDWVAVGFSLGGITVYSTSNLDEVDRLRGHSGAVTDLRFAGKDLLASLGADGTLRYWPIQPHQRSGAYDEPPKWIVAEDIDPAQVSESLPASQTKPEPASPGRPYGTLVRILHPDQSPAVTAGDDNQVRVWDTAEQPTLLLSFRPPGSKIQKLAFNRDGTRLVGQFMTPGQDNVTEAIWQAAPWTREKLGIAPAANWQLEWETRRSTRFAGLWKQK